jgi:hypothetical protein
MIQVAGDARVLAGAHKISDDDLIFTVVVVQVGGIVGRYAGFVASADDNPMFYRRQLNAR